MTDKPKPKPTQDTLKIVSNLPAGKVVPVGKGMKPKPRPSNN